MRDSHLFSSKQPIGARLLTLGQHLVLGRPAQRLYGIELVVKSLGAGRQAGLPHLLQPFLAMALAVRLLAAAYHGMAAIEALSRAMICVVSSVSVV